MKLSRSSLLIGLLTVLFLSACGGGNSASSAKNSIPDSGNLQTAGEDIQIFGAGIKGPLAFADTKVFSFDPSFPDLYDSTSPISTAITDQYARISNLSVPGNLQPPYILVIGGDQAIDLNTGKPPVISKLTTVITKNMLESKRPVYATPLTTLAFYMARALKSTNTSANTFIEQLDIASAEVNRLFSIDVNHTFDIFESPLIISSTTDTLTKQEEAVYHRASLEAFAAKIYRLSLRNNITSVSIIERLAIDIQSDGIIDNANNGTLLGGIDPELLMQGPAKSSIPNTAYQIKDTFLLMEEERTALGEGNGPELLVASIEFNKPSTDKNTYSRTITDPIQAIAPTPDQISNPSGGSAGAAVLVDLRGNPPEQRTVAINVSKPGNAVNGIITLATYDADFPDEGELIINGNTPVPLFGKAGVEGNDQNSADITFSTPASYWNDGKNTLLFRHTRTNQGYVIDGMTVTFNIGSGGSAGSSILVLSTNSIDFGALNVGDVSDAAIVTLTNNGNAPLTITDITVSDGFITNNDCNNYLPAGNRCMISTNYVPTTANKIIGSLTIDSNSIGGPISVSLKGNSIVNNQPAAQPIAGPNITDTVFNHDFNSEALHTYTKNDPITTWGARTGIVVRPDAVKIVNDPDPSGAHENVMQVFYAGGQYQYKGNSGGQWVKNLDDYDELYFAFDVFFESDAEFVKGGKLPSPRSTDWLTNFESGRKPDGTDFWTTGLAWFNDGELITYSYHAWQGSRWGQHISWDDGPDGKKTYFTPGKWHQVEIRVKINTPGVLDGRLQGWFDGEKRLDTNQIMFRKPGGEHLRIGTYLFYTFFGGNNTDHAPSTDQHIYFDNFVISQQPITH